MAITASRPQPDQTYSIREFPARAGARAREDLDSLPERYSTAGNADHNHDHDNYNNNYTRARAREEAQKYHARQMVSNMEQLRELVGYEVLDTYEDVFGRPMPRFVQREVADLLADVQTDMVVAVLEYTACAPRPSWAYARAVLIRNRDMGVRSAVAFRTALNKRCRDQIDDMPY